MVLGQGVATSSSSLATSLLALVWLMYKLSGVRDQQLLRDKSFLCSLGF